MGYNEFPNANAVNAEIERTGLDLTRVFSIHGNGLLNTPAPEAVQAPDVNGPSNPTLG